MIVLRLFLLLLALSALGSLAPRAHETAPPAPGSQLSAAQRQVYKTAIELFEARRHDQALALARTGGDPLFDRVIRWLDMTRRDSPAGFAELDAFVTQHPDWPGQVALRRNAELAMPAGFGDRALPAWFAGRAPRTVVAALRLAEALERQGEADQSRELLRTTWVTGNFGQVQERAFRRRYRKLLSHEDEVARLDRLLWRGSASAARRQALRLGDAYARLADARLRLRDAKPGVDYAVKRVPKRFLRDPGFLYDRARWRQRKGRTAGVVELIDALPPAPPRSEKWWPLRRWAARRLLDDGGAQAAYRMAAGHGLEAGVGFAEGEWLAGWIALRFLKRPALAAGHFARLHDGVTGAISRARGAYWAGQAAAAQSQAAEAARWTGIAAEHGTTFYGQAARQSHGQPVPLALGSIDKPTAAARQRFEARDLVKVVRVLSEVEAPKLQDRFFAALRAGADQPADYHLIADLARAAGRPDQALRTAKKARRRDIWIADHLYPLPSLPPHAGAPDGLEPALVLALIRQESAFYSRATSRAGARGLMQLMPATAKQVAKGLNLQYRRAALTEDPAYNLRLGRSYLAQMLERFDGSVLLALAAYNAGPHRAAAWIRAYGDPRRPGVDPIDWAERIPFAETRNYVQRVLESRTVYRDLLSRADTAVEPAPVKLGALR